jgi:glutathione gamma-glutamylcysteinyltransferase
MTAPAPASFHRRPLPDDLVDFSSAQGRRWLQEALAAGSAEAFYPLVAHLHTQAEPAWCGLGTMVTVLNALQIDPGRAWRGPWRFFGEELLICCKSMELATAEGLSLAEVGCLASCNGASSVSTEAATSSLEAFREDLERSVRAPAGPFLVANYARGALGQTGDGHFSPIAAWHAPSDHALILDVARFKYPPHWAPVERLFAAMATTDPSNARSRGWLLIGNNDQPAASPPAGADELVARLRALGACPPSRPR